MTPHEELSSAIDQLAEDGKRPPCSTNPERWTGDDPDTHLRAATICLVCPLRTPCSAVGALESWGVWGGVWRGKPIKRKTRAA